MRLRLWRVKMDLAAIVDDTITRLGSLFTLWGKRICRRQIGGAGRNLAMTAGNIDNVIRLTQSRNPSTQRTHKVLAFFQCRSQMRGSGGKITMVQVVGFDAAFDKAAHQ